VIRAADCLENPLPRSFSYCGQFFTCGPGIAQNTLTAQMTDRIRAAMAMRVVRFQVSGIS
jgi:hypothetical protein